MATVAPALANTVGSGEIAPTPNIRADDPAFSGRARILVVNGTDLWDPNPQENTIGCINKVGKVIPVSSECAVFEKQGPGSGYGKIVSSEGNCTFGNKLSPANTDSYYGKESYAWFCGLTDVKDEAWRGFLENEQYWNITGSPTTYLGTGNLYRVFDMRAPPAGQEETFAPMDLWVFYYGGHELYGASGHIEVKMWWDRVDLE
ncbi:hypothetical protein QBC37DRAFT_377407 [Rhypophila decipiens]|uniref:Uncharacterized protein n=1 Tax=Rhypophila decipiens TaxID=261697 RepID=A0AAN6Y107_9PEZI|nr:hypothetical protein QBC37DRAFT_377407 [Rhypophila decipiens]